MNTITIHNEKELKAFKKENINKMIFIPSGPGGKIHYPVTITISN